MPPELYAQLNALRDTYRGKMNRATAAAQIAAETEEMHTVFMHAAEADQFGTAFAALNQAIELVNGYFAKH